MKNSTDHVLIAAGLQVMEARRKGGVTTFTKYGEDHFSKLGKISAEKRRKMRLATKDLVDND